MPTPAERWAAARTGAARIRSTRLGWLRLRRLRFWPVVFVPAALPTVIRLIGDGDHAWPIMIVTFTPEAALTLVVLTALALVRRRWRTGAVGGLLVLLNVVWLIPLYVGDAVPAGGTDLTAMTINLQYGWADATQVADAVRTRRVDVLGVTELTPEAVTALTEAGLDRELPYRVLSPDVSAHGSGLWARYPLTAAEEWRGVHRWPGATMRLTDSGGATRDVAVRVAHPYRTARYNATSYRRDQAMLRERLAAQPKDVPAIVLGDFNASRDHAAFRRLLSDGWRDAPEYAGSGFVGTWSARYWMPYLVQLDHILINRQFGARSTSTFSVDGSDHGALVARLVLAPAV